VYARDRRSAVLSALLGYTERFVVSSVYRVGYDGVECAYRAAAGKKSADSGMGNGGSPEHPLRKT